MTTATLERADLRDERAIRREIIPSDPLKRAVMRNLRFNGNVLGRTLDRIVVISDGSFWFETDDFEVMENSIRHGVGRIEVWVRRERGSELLRRV